MAAKTSDDNINIAPDILPHGPVHNPVRILNILELIQYPGAVRVASDGFTDAKTRTRFPDPMHEADTFLYHIVAHSEWEIRSDAPHYDTDDRTEIGFIHLSFAHQLASTIERFFSGRNDLLILRVDPRRLPSLKCEDLYGHGEFPHHYGPIPGDAIVDKRRWNGKNPYGN